MSCLFFVIGSAPFYFPPSYCSKNGAEGLFEVGFVYRICEVDLHWSKRGSRKSRAQKAIIKKSKAAHRRTEISTYWG